MRSQQRSKFATVLIALTGVIAVAGAVQADELKMTQPASSSPASSSSERPTRGMSMDKVEATFGAPTRRVPAVGQPPISRWEYPGFTVYFEHNHVIHAVVAG